MSVEKEHRLYLQNDKVQTKVLKIVLEEGKSKVLTFNKKDFHPRILYSEVNPMWNLLLPGFSHFQAHDYVCSALFGGLWIIDISIFVYSIYGFYIADNIVRNDERLYYREQIKPYRDLYFNVSIASGLGWILISLGSFWHAELMKSNELNKKQYEVKISNDELFIYAKLEF